MRRRGSSGPAIGNRNETGLLHIRDVFRLNPFFEPIKLSLKTMDCNMVCTVRWNHHSNRGLEFLSKPVR